MLPTIPKPSLLAAILLAAACASAQQYTPPPPDLTAAPCKPTKKDPCTPVPAADTRPATVANPFPFPGDAPDHPAGAPIPAPATPAPATTPAAPTAPAGAFPFPGDAPDLPADAPVPNPSNSSSSSYSSSSSSSSGDTPIPDEPEEKGSTRFARKHLPKVEDLDTREAKDLEVSHYYITTGNFQAAYLRAKDAVATIPEDPAAHFALADTAARLQKKDEAIKEYTAYLKLEPDGEKAPAAQKALATLKPK